MKYKKRNSGGEESKTD